MIVKTACVQLNSSDNMDANIEDIGLYVAQAAAQGAQLVALPENCFMMSQPGGKRTYYDEVGHPGINAARQMARRHGIWLLIGSVSVVPDVLEDGYSGKTFNRSLLLNPQGEIAARYDKIHLFDVEVGDGQTYEESARILPGGKAVTSTINGIRLGMSICYDLRFPQLYRTLAKAGAQILAVPAAFTQVTGEAHWHVLLRARAIENACFVIAPAQCGVHPGNRHTFGHSLIIDPWGKVLADGGDAPGIIMAELDMGLVDKIRGNLPSLRHDREFS